MKIKIIAIIIVVLLGGLSYKFLFQSAPKTLAYYLENKEEREGMLKKCDKMGLQMLSNQDCVNAANASSKARMDHVLDGYKPSTHKGVPLNSY